MKHEAMTNFEPIPDYVPPTHKEMEQVFFDCVCGHLLRQKRHSRVKPRGVCVYRAKDGLMCAIGCLMDDRYDPIMEGRPVGDEEIITACNMVRPCQMETECENLMTISDYQLKSYSTQVSP